MWGVRLFASLQRAALLSAIALLPGVSAAHAQCTPDPAVSGDTVTCTGNDPNGFAAGGGVNNLTVNIQPGATVQDNGTAAIAVNDGNTVTNRGAVTAADNLTGITGLNANTFVNIGAINLGQNAIGLSVGDSSAVTNSGAVTGGNGSTGIFSGLNNTITNAATGTLTLGDGGIGIYGAGGNTVTNLGAIAIGAGGGLSGGIIAINDGNTIVNAAGASISGGDSSQGIFAQGNNNTITNGGSIANTQFSVGIGAQGHSVSITNTGTITGGDQSAGINHQGNNATIVSSGAISTGDAGAGVAMNGSSGMITNTGSITTGGNAAAGITVLGGGNTIVNTGTITVGDVFSTGISTFGLAPGSNNRIINAGTINVGTDGTSVGIQVDNDGSVFNSGTINAANGLFAIEFCNCSADSSLTITPTSVINGLVQGTGSQVFQLGGTGTGTFDLSLIGPGKQYDGFATFNKIDASHWILTGVGNQDWTMFGGMLTLNGILNGQVVVNDGSFVMNGSVNGGVTVNAGALTANGVMNGAVIVNAGGTLAGTGTVGNTTINGGTLSPGNSIGTLTVQGNLVLSSAAAYVVEVGAVTSDRTIVTGTATIAGTVQAVFSGPLLQRYTILSANGGVVGTFAALTTVSQPAGLAMRLTYDANNVYLNTTAVLGNGQGLNQNQQNVATSLNTFFNGGGALPERFGALFALAGDSLRSALSQLSGEIATQGAQAAFSSVDYFLNLMLDPFVTSRGGDVAAGGRPGANNFAGEETDADAYAARRKRSPGEQDAYAAMARKAVPRNNPLDPRWSVWGAGYGGELKADGNAVIGARDASTRAFGFAAGADYRLSPDTLVGFALSGGATSFSLAHGAGSGRSDVFQAGAFVRHDIGQGYVKGAVAYGWHDVTTERVVALAGLDRLEGRYDAHSLGARGEAGYRFATPWMGVTPYAAAQAITYYMPGYADQATLGLNSFALDYASRDVTAARTELGLRMDRSFALQSALVTVRGRAAWAHYFDDDRALTASFQTIAAPAFVVTGAAQARDAALVSASAEASWTNGFSLAGVFEGEFSAETRGYAGKGILRYSW
jgi:uncharacterized protein with beta-barrel porin domain